MTNNRLNIGIFTCHIDNDYATEVCKGAEYAAKELDCNLIVFPGMFLNASFYDPANQLYDYQYNSIFYYAHPECLDALIISVGAISSLLSEKDMNSFLSHFDGIPILTLEEKLPGYPCIRTDNSRGMRDAIEHLIKEHKRKHICFVAGKDANTSPIFEDGSSEGNLMLVNESINNYPQMVQIIRNDTGEEIYKSGAIAVGSKIERAKLDVVLPAGTYECTAYFHNLNPDTGDIIGTAGAIITITIKN